MRTRLLRPWLAWLVLAGAAAGASGALASDRSLRVHLTVTGSSRLDAGERTRLIATAALPRRARLVISASRSGARATKLVECRRSPCSTTFRDTRAEAVAFQALAVVQAGGRQTTLGRSRVVQVTWSKPAPPAPAPPAAMPGRYRGHTADNELWAFDIGADGLSLANLQTGQINESCDPPAYLSGGDLRFPGPVSVAADGSFSITSTVDGTVSGNPSTDAVTITGHVGAGVASGTYRVDTSFTANGQGYSCTSGDQTWTASRTG